VDRNFQRVRNGTGVLSASACVSAARLMTPPSASGPYRVGQDAEIEKARACTGRPQLGTRDAVLEVRTLFGLSLVRRIKPIGRRRGVDESSLEEVPP
jgi:hypothetical protein